MSQIDDLIDSLSASIFFGIGRSASQAAETPGELAKAFAGLSGRTPEHALLDKLALTMIYRRAGSLPTTSQDNQLPQAEAEIVDQCSEAATALISSLISQGNHRLIFEALHMLKEADLRLPPTLLPDFLDMGAAHPTLRQPIKRVMGRRGEWLANLNPSWNYASALNNSAPLAYIADTKKIYRTWDILHGPERLQLLQSIRTRDVSLARRLIERTWQEETAAVREAQLNVLSDGLTSDDAPLLGTALFDRSAGVRRIAIELLASLPESGLSTAAVREAEKYIHVKRNINGQKRLTARPPEKYDPIWKQFDITETSSITDIGDRAWLAAQWIAFLNVDYWRTRHHLTPESLMSLVEETEWADAVRLGLSRAAKRSADIAWKYNTLKFWTLKKDPRTSISLFLPKVDDLKEAASSLILEVMATYREPLDDSHPALPLLRSFSGGWSDDLAQAVIASTALTAEKPLNRQPPVWLMQLVLAEAAYKVSPRLLTELSEILGANPVSVPTWAKSIDNFLNVLKLRRDMYLEIVP